MATPNPSVKYSIGVAEIARARYHVIIATWACRNVLQP